MPACSTCGLAVEWLRSCYASEWRLFRGRPDMQTAGEYYFSPAETPFYAGWHNLSSAVWHDANHPQIIQLGEAPVKRSWRSGDFRVADVRESAIGNADCLQFGEDPADTVPAEMLVDGFIPACHLTEVEVDVLWEQVSSYESCATQRIYASLLVMLYEGDEANIRKTISDWLGDSVVVSITLHTGVRNGVITLRLGAWMAAVVDGTFNAQELALQAFIFPRGPQNFGPYSSHPFWLESSTYILSILQANGMQAGQKFFICGHSYGAAVSYNLLARFRHWEPDRLLRYCTFASPKIGDERMVRLIQRCDGISIINDSDFVTILPPDRWTVAPFAALLGGIIVALYEQWWRPPSQWLVALDGSFTGGATPNLDYYTLRALVDEMLAGRTLDPSISHRMPAYVGRLQTRCPDEEWPINVVTQKDVWFPTGALVLTGDLRPKGALIFHGVPIPVPGALCADALALPLEDWYDLDLTSTVALQWVKWSIPAGPAHTYTLDYEIVSGTAVELSEFRLGTCATGITLSLSDLNSSVPISTSGDVDLIMDSFLLTSGTRTIRVRLRF